MATEFTHLDPLGRARMVDVTPKEATHRRAVARCRIHMSPDTASLIASGAITKGDVLAVARVAGIQAAKRTPDMLPLCHPLLVGSVYVNFTIEDSYVEVEAQIETFDRTGVEMEALTACAVAGLTVYDMCKSVDRGMEIGDLALWEKTGGSGGVFRRKSLEDTIDEALEKQVAANPDGSSDNPGDLDDLDDLGDLGDLGDLDDKGDPAV